MRANESPIPRNPEVDAYIRQQPEPVAEIMTKIREIIHDTVPDCSERITWRMPTFKWNGVNICHFAGHKEHLGFYPGPQAIEILSEELKPYHTSKGAIQFPYKKEIPFELIRRIVLTAYAVQADPAQGKTGAFTNTEREDLGGKL